MADHVFILGAGASSECGAPMMAGFLDTAEDIWRSGLSDGNAQAFGRVFEALDHLRAIHAKARLDLGNIETLFSVIEMAVLLDRLGKLSSVQITEIRDALVRMIVTTLETRIWYPASGGREHREPPPAYKGLAGLLDKIREQKKETCSLITFNYDVALDYALIDAGSSVDYCLSDEATVPSPRSIRLLKLHGSTGWGLCSQCHQVIPCPPAEFRRACPITPEERSRGRASLPISRWLQLNLHPQDGGRYEPSPVIVPPTWNKGAYHDDLRLVWKAAADELREARNIYVIGYSLPETDSFFRYLYALGTLSASRIRRFWVFNPDETREASYRGLVGGEVADRYYKYDRAYFTQPLSMGRPGAPAPSHPGAVQVISRELLGT
jgi:NAD-dependent SIR2 family protein deacetylase